MVLSVKRLIADLRQKLELKVITGHQGLNSKIQTINIDRPALYFPNYSDEIKENSILIFGLPEKLHFDNCSPDKLQEFLNQIFQKKPVLCLLCEKFEWDDELFRQAPENNVAVLKSAKDSDEANNILYTYLKNQLAPVENIHGVLVEVFGMGTLIIGDSSIGKSECALALVERGHRLVADDVVEVKKISENLIGTGPDIIKYHMEVRGLGIINLKNLFGTGSIIDKKEINMIIEIQEWDDEKEYDRLGIDDLTHEILGVAIPKVLIPVRPGRNLTVLIETAVMNQRSKKLGYHSARELNKNLIGWVKSETPL